MPGTPPRKQTIWMIFEIDDDNNVDKLMSSEKAHAGIHGEFIWKFRNETNGPLQVDLRNFNPPNFIEFEDDLPVDVKKGATVTATVVKNNGTKNQPVTYDVYIKTDQTFQKLDPDIIIDGDGGVIKGGKKDGDKKNGGKKKASKKR